MVVCVVLLVFFIIKQGQGLDYALSILSLFIIAALDLCPQLLDRKLLTSNKIFRAPLDVVTTNIKDLNNLVVKKSVMKIK